MVTRRGLLGMLGGSVVAGVPELARASGKSEDPVRGEWARRLCDAERIGCRMEFDFLVAGHCACPYCGVCYYVPRSYLLWRQKHPDRSVQVLDWNLIQAIEKEMAG